MTLTHERAVELAAGAEPTPLELPLVAGLRAGWEFASTPPEPENSWVSTVGHGSSSAGAALIGAAAYSTHANVPIRHRHYSPLSNTAQPIFVRWGRDGLLCDIASGTFEEIAEAIGVELATAADPKPFVKAVRSGDILNPTFDLVRPVIADSPRTWDHIERYVQSAAPISPSQRAGIVALSYLAEHSERPDSNMAGSLLDLLPRIYVDRIDSPRNLTEWRDLLGLSASTWIEAAHSLWAVIQTNVRLSIGAANSATWTIGNMTHSMLGGWSPGRTNAHIMAQFAEREEATSRDEWSRFTDPIGAFYASWSKDQVRLVHLNGATLDLNGFSSPFRLGRPLCVLETPSVADEIISGLSRTPAKYTPSRVDDNAVELSKEPDVAARNVLAVRPPANSVLAFTASRESNTYFELRAAQQDVSPYPPPPTEILVAAAANA